MVYLFNWIKCLCILGTYQFFVLCVSDSRFAEKDFTDSFIYGRKVTCESSNNTRQIYPAPTWTCSNMKIEGMRLRRQYIKQTSSKMEFQNLYDAKNDMRALCQALLHQHQINGPVWTAYAREIAKDEITQKRVIFKRTDTAYDWETIPIQRNITGRGYVRSLACTLVS